MQVRTKEERRSKHDEKLELKSVKQLVMNGAVFERMMEGMPVVSGRVGGGSKVLWDTGCSGWWFEKI